MFRLLGNSSFLGVTVAQFFAALNDNAMRQAFLLLAVEAAAQELQASASALFALPFILFSPIAGQIADRFSKKTVIVITKAMEVFVVSLAAYAILIDSFGILLIAILLMATQSTFFSPAKYGILPEILDYEDLSRGNGLIQMTTYMAILLGAALAGILLQVLPAYWTGLSLVVMGVVGFLPTLIIDPVEVADPESSLDWNAFRSVASNLAWVRHERTLFMSMLGFSFFFFIGTLVTLNLNVYGLNVMEVGEAYTSLLMVALSIGLGLGSLLAGRWSGDGIEVGLVPLGIVGMATFLIVFTFTIESLTLAYIYLVFAGIFGGLFLIPLQTILQEYPPDDKVGDVLGTTNIITFVGVLLASALYVVLIGWMQIPATTLMLVIGLITLVAGFGLVVGLPRPLLRFLSWLLTHSLYDVTIRNSKNIPREGPAVIVANHVSLVDGFLVNACFSRLVRFIGFGPFFEIPIVGYLFRLMEMIPVYPGEDDQIEQALDRAREELKQGNAVCIFPEGTITRTGLMSPVRGGVERLVGDMEEDIPVIPVHLDEVWGSIFSYSEGEFLWKMPSRIPYPVTVSFGDPIEPVTTDRVREGLQELGAESALDLIEESNTLPEELIGQAHRTPFRPALGINDGKSLNYIELLSEVLAVRKALKGTLYDKDRVGVLLPPGRQGVIANLALAFLGISSVNLPHGEEWPNPQKYYQLCELDTLITDWKRVKQVDETIENDNVLLIQDIYESISDLDRLQDRLLSYTPSKLIQRGVSTEPTDPATIIFTRGTSGEPKAVKLSHANILANIQSLQQVYVLEGTDTLLSGLPLFHSYGYTASLWFPLIMGSQLVPCDDPFNSNKIELLTDDYEISTIVGLPSYYDHYLEHCDPDTFGRVKLALTGGNALEEKIYEGFRERFGVEIYEGYGCAEMSPAISMNVPNVTRDGEIYQRGNKPGSVGRPLPGVAVKIVDPETMNRVPVDEEGLILVKGANQMLGYLNGRQSTEEAFHEGWFVTGDIGSFDEEGFLHLHGRYDDHEDSSDI